MAKSPLSSVDTAWLRMEDPTNLMMITGVMIFGAPMDFERLKVTIAHRLLRFDRFRQHVVQSRLPIGGHYWQDDPQFDLHAHVHRVSLTPPGDLAALQELVSELMGTPLDFSRPLWEIHLVEHYADGSAIGDGAAIADGCALIVRLHHCIADGIALVRVLLSLTDTDPAAPWPSATLREPRTGHRGPLETLLKPARAALKTSAQVAETVLKESQELLGNPAHAVDLARLGASGALALGRLLLLSPDPKTIFKGELGVAKRASWSDPIPLAEVKAAGRAMEGTVNDVLLTAVTGALRRYMQSRDESVEKLDFRAVVPVNLRPLEEALTLGNQFGLVFLSLPVGIGDPLARLRELKRRMDALKDTPEALVALGILNAIGMSPAQVQDIVVNRFGTKGTGVMTNVPGPEETIYLAGAPLDTIMFWVPQSGRLGLGVSILSYAGKVWLGIATDAGLVPDPENIIAAFHTEFDALLELTRRMEASEKTPAAALPTASIARMTAILDDAIQKVSAMIEETAPAAGMTLEATTVHCQALTRAGRPCKNAPLSGSEFCRVHQKQAEEAV